MKYILPLLTIALASAGAMAVESPLWLRNTALSPDGATIAFTYRGDIYTVPADGGRATRLTTDRGYDSEPFWSPDGTRIAFSSDREGSDDIFVVDAKGGTPRRLTTHSGAESPRGWLNDSTVVFTAKIQPSALDLNAPWFRQTYTVDANRPSARPRLFFSLQTRAGDFNAEGDYIFEDWKGVDDPLRKHEMSSATGDIYKYSKGRFTRLTSFRGNDRNPVWMGTKNYAYTSEQDGTLNVYSAPADGSAAPRQLTHFKGNPVRSLSSDARGDKLAFSYDGEIYTLVPGGQPRKVNVEIASDLYDADIVKRYSNAGADNLAVSPSGDEIAFTLRGEIYVTSNKYRTTLRITDTAGQERCMSFGEDGRTLYYDSERNGNWAIYRAKIKDDSEKSFAYATEIVEEPVYSSEKYAVQQPAVSPDGKKLAFLEDRTTIRVMDLDSRKVVTALDGKYNFSYVDGDIEFTWSPDSKWLLTTYLGIGGWNNPDVALVKADGTQTVDLTESGYSDSSGKWALDGRAVTYTSGRDGMKSHGSWGNQSDVYMMVLDPVAWEKYNRTEEEADLAEKAEKDEKEDSSDKSDKSKTKKAKESEKAQKAKKAKKSEEESRPFDLANRNYRTVRLTGSSSLLRDYFVNAKADKLYYTAPATEGGFNLYVRNLKDGSTSILAQGKGGGFEVDRKGENIYMFSQGGIVRIELSSGKSTPIEYEAQYDRHPSLERQYIFNHVHRQVRDKFHDANFHGCDWEAYCDHYARFLPYISNDRDFAILLSELLGELNASHTGASAHGYGPAMSTASLGAFFDGTYSGDGLKVDSIMPRSPLALASAGIAPGDIILAVDGAEIKAGQDYFPLLEGKAGRKTLLTVRKPDGKVKTASVRPFDAGSERELRYEMWIERNEKFVDSISGGKIGYVHIRQMDSGSFREVYSKLLGKYRNADAVVVDTRFNPGGWLHNDVAALLSGKEVVRYQPRGRYIGSDSFDRWFKPSVMLVNEANYSDGHGTPYVYRSYNIGKIIGAPIPGTMTAVWWEQQINPSIVFGIPQVTSLDRNGKMLENQQLEPDIVVLNTPADIISGNDVQLRRAVEELMK